MFFLDSRYRGKDTTTRREGRDLEKEEEKNGEIMKIEERKSEIMKTEEKS